MHLKNKLTNKEIISFLKSHKNELREKYGVIQIGLFGSFVRNEQNEDSDIDLAVEIEKNKKTLKNFFELKRVLEKKLNKKVDLGIESSLKPILKERIKQEIIYA